MELPPLCEPCSDWVLRDRAVEGGADQLLISELAVSAMDQPGDGPGEGVVVEIASSDASDQLSRDSRKNC